MFGRLYIGYNGLQIKWQTANARWGGVTFVIQNPKIALLISIILPMKFEKSTYPLGLYRLSIYLCYTVLGKKPLPYKAG